jgi:hypothetical protein
MWDELYSKTMNIVDFSVPVMVQKCTSDGVPIKKALWESSKLRRSRKSKDKAWNIFDSSPTSINLKLLMRNTYSNKLLEMQRVTTSRSLHRTLNIIHNPVGSVVNPVSCNQAINRGLL